MGIRLIVEVLDHAPAEFTTAERLVFIVYAESANDGTRTCWPPDELVAHRTGLTVKGVRKVLRRLRDRGYDPRVVLRIGKDGRPVYAWRNHAARYRIPSFPQRQVPTRERATPEGKPFEKEGLPQEEERVTPEGTKGLPMGVTPSPHIPSVPSPARAREDQHSPTRALNDDDEKIIDEIAGWHTELYGNPCPRTHAVAIRAMFNGTAMSSPSRYIRTAMTNDRDKYRYRPGPPRFVGGEFVT